METLYSAKEINDIMGYVGGTQNNSKEQLMTRCRNAGLIIESVETPRGCPNKYRIIENNLTLPNEEWRVCVMYNEWEVSSLGRIRRINTKKLLGQADSSGYVAITGKNEGGKGNKTARYLVHRLVYFSFHPEVEPDKALIIDHINGKRDDNRLSNLRCLSTQTNTRLRDEHQGELQSLMFSLIQKYGYEALKKKLNTLLNEN